MYSAVEKLFVQSAVSLVKYRRVWTLDTLASLSRGFFAASAEISDLDMSQFLEEDGSSHEQEILETTGVQGCVFECSQHMFSSLTRI